MKSSCVRDSLRGAARLKKPPRNATPGAVRNRLCNHTTWPYGHSKSRRRVDSAVEQAPHPNMPRHVSPHTSPQFIRGRQALHPNMPRHVSPYTSPQFMRGRQARPQLGQCTGVLTVRVHVHAAVALIQ